jgi:hypothetical protein
MSQTEIDFGLRRLAAIAPEFEIGGISFETDAFHLRLNGRLAVELSREVIEDLQGSPELEGIVREGVHLAQEEAKKSSPRVIQIATTGTRYKG